MIFQRTACCGLITLVNNMLLSSPRPWGCFSLAASSACFCKVFPTPVGVFLPLLITRLPLQRLPHARGGVSFTSIAVLRVSRSSPRPWGCFHGRIQATLQIWVFPTPVGVFLGDRKLYSWTGSLPHARGGVSSPARIAAIARMSSPRPWGCF